MYHHIARLLFIALIVCGPMILDAQEQASKTADQLRTELENDGSVALCPPDASENHNKLEKYLASTSNTAIESRIAIGIDHLQEMPIRVLENPEDADTCAYFNSLYSGYILQKRYYKNVDYGYVSDAVYYNIGNYYFVVIHSPVAYQTKEGNMRISTAGAEAIYI